MDEREQSNTKVTKYVNEPYQASHLKSCVSSSVSFMPRRPSRLLQDINNLNVGSSYKWYKNHFI